MISDTTTQLLYFCNQIVSGGTIGYPHTEQEQLLWNTLDYVAGVDEAGRGALAGPVVAAAVVLPKHCKGISGVRDSKQITHKQREEMLEEITGVAVCIGVGIVEHDVIDEINILQATYCAMNDAITQLQPVPEFLLIDGNRFTESTIPFKTIVAGDDSSLSIACASIVAKVTRDRIMDALHLDYPVYGFVKNKGYGTTAHRQSILLHGTCDVHRSTFLRKLFETQYTLFGEK